MLGGADAILIASSNVGSESFLLGTVNETSSLTSNCCRKEQSDDGIRLVKLLASAVVWFPSVSLITSDVSWTGTETE